VLEYLEARQLLLVLDNFEHLLQARTVVLELLQRCPRVAVLATSRAPLRLQAERRVVIGPLSTPLAVQLFVERARAAAADFSVNATNAAAVADICRRLDGLPLAIELAAARVQMLAPVTLAGSVGAAACRTDRRRTGPAASPADAARHP
jgi:predicted ATPase